MNLYIHGLCIVKVVIMNCSNHKKEVAGISDMKVLAEMIGNLHYESLSQLFDEISSKIYDDGRKDFVEGRTDLGHELFMASQHINEAFIDIKNAWEISKPFMNTIDN